MKKVVSVIMILCLSAGLSGMNPQDREIADVVKPCVDQAINDAVGRYCVQAVVREAEWPVHMLKLSIKHAGLRSDAAVRLQEIKDVCLSAESELDSAKYMLVGGQQAHAVLQKVLRECAHQVELCNVSSDASIAVLQESFKKLSQLLDNDRSHVQKQIDLVVAQEQDQRNQARELLAKAASQAVEVAERKVRDTHYASMRAALEKNIHHKVAHVAAREQYRKQAIAAADNARAQAQRKAELQELAAREKKSSGDCA